MMWRDWNTDGPHDDSECVKGGYECDPEMGFVLYRYPFEEGPMSNERRRLPFVTRLMTFESGMRTFEEWASPCEEPENPTHESCKYYVKTPIAWLPWENAQRMLLESAKEKGGRDEV